MGLKLINKQKDLDDENDNRKMSYGFLSSIEVLLIEKVSIFQMQNIDHLHWILQKINNMPKHSETTGDFTKIRNYYFDNMSKFYRQTIVYSELMSAEVNSIFNKSSFNYNGIIKQKIFYKNFIGDLLEKNNLRVECFRLDFQKFSDDYEQRYNYFMNQIWKKLRSNKFNVQYVIFVSSYLEFIKLKKYFK